MTYEELKKELEANDYYIEEVEGDEVILINNSDEAELASKILEAYNESNEDGDLFLNRHEIEILYNEQVVTCDQCGKKFYIDHDRGVYGEYGFICEDCLQNESVAEDYIDWITNQTDRAFLARQIDESVLTSMGFKKSDAEYETGLYKTSDKVTPQDIYNSVKCDVVFQVLEYNPFSTLWTYWVKAA